MSSINDLKAQNYIETESKRYEQEVKQMKSENERTYSSESKQKELELKKMREDYETRISNMKSEQERKLGEIRQKQSRNMTEESSRLKQEIENDKLKIGSIYAGGIVFYIDNSGKHGLVCAEIDFGKAKWGGFGEIGAVDMEIGVKNENTKKIVELASWFVDEGFFRTTKRPAPTAARLCLESSYNGYTDWYLPTIKELELMFNNLHTKQMGNLATKGGTIEIVQDAKIATYTLSTGMSGITTAGGGTFFNVNVGSATQIEFTSAFDYGVPITLTITPNP